MQSAYRKIRATPFVLLGIVLLTMACQKKCQQPAQQAFTSITGTDWRLVETTDPQVSSTLSNFTFLIWHFDQNFTGAIFKVINNEKYNNPVFNLVFNVNPTQQLLSVQFLSPQAADPNGGGQQQGGGTDAGTYVYQYSLGTQLNLSDQSNGYQYTFVPFQGIVQPDENCSF